MNLKLMLLLALEIGTFTSRDVQGIPFRQWTEENSTLLRTTREPNLQFHQVENRLGRTGSTNGMKQSLWGLDGIKRDWIRYTWQALDGAGFFSGNVRPIYCRINMYRSRDNMRESGSGYFGVTFPAGDIAILSMFADQPEVSRDSLFCPHGAARCYRNFAVLRFGPAGTYNGGGEIVCDRYTNQLAPLTLGDVRHGFRDLAYRS